MECQRNRRKLSALFSSSIEYQSVRTHDVSLNIPLTETNQMKPLRLFLTAVLISLSILSCTKLACATDNLEMLVPADTKLSLQLLSPISTATNKKGDKFSCKVLTPAEYAGAIAEGYIRNLKHSGKANKESKVDLAFERITLPDGRTSDFRATVIEVFDVVTAGDQGRADNEGTVRSKSKTVKTSVKKAAAGALIGGLIGAVVAGGHGAAIGAAIGASVGVTTTLASKGVDLEFKEGTQFTVQCNGPRRKQKQPVPSNPSPGTQLWGSVVRIPAPGGDSGSVTMRMK